MKTHELKTWPEYFIQVMYGNKTFEIRKNDRDFQVGDQLILKEYNPKNNEYTGEICKCNVTYITDYEQKDGYVVMAIF